MFPESCGVDNDASFVAVHSVVTSSQHFDRLRVSALTAAHSTQQLLRVRPRATVTYYEDAQQRSFRLPFRAYDLLRHGLLTRFTVPGRKSLLYSRNISEEKSEKDSRSQRTRKSPMRSCLLDRTGKGPP